MKCELCGQVEAAVRLTAFVGGELRSALLCRRCSDEPSDELKRFWPASGPIQFRHVAELPVLQNVAVKNELPALRQTPRAAEAMAYAAAAALIEPANPIKAKHFRDGAPIVIAPVGNGFVVNPFRGEPTNPCAEALVFQTLDGLLEFVRGQFTPHPGEGVA